MGKQKCLQLICLMLVTIWLSSNSFSLAEMTLKTATFKSPAFTLRPGEVQNKFYYEVPFPEGHIGIKAFDAEVVNEEGHPVPLSDVYLHHWIVLNYVSGNQSQNDIFTGNIESSRILGNDGVCPDRTLSQLFGLGSETRHTNTSIPGPHAIEAGVYDEERWFLNVHAIDTRGTIDPFGCLECRCDLYNVSVDEYGRPLQDGYIGGLQCCYDGTQCQLKEGYSGENRTYYLQYTVHYWEWSEQILPVKVYILDVTYEAGKCKIEYDVPACSFGNNKADCEHIQESTMTIPVGGDVIYAVSHQHGGGVGATIYGEDGREICASIPVYGTGIEAGNEAGYIVGMSTCYPQTGTVRILNGESLQVKSHYSMSSSHTGVMGLAYIIVYPNADISTM